MGLNQAWRLRTLSKECSVEKNRTVLGTNKEAIPPNIWLKE